MTSPSGDDERTILRPAPVYPNALPAGAILAEFEITRVIGQGGFGIVYLARDHSLGRDVALKEYMPSAFAGRAGDCQVTVLSEHYAETFNLGLSSFVKEAQLLARFDHPCLVKVYRFWEANGTGYMAMPFYQAPTLKQILKAGSEQCADEAWLKRFLGHVLDALQVLHDKQCYHRDISPDNILMLDHDIPLLLDFGAARRVIGDVTQALTVILKPGYAPVEQYGEMEDMAQGPWTDLYALASVVYFIIAGKVPQAALSRLAADKLVPLAESARDRYSPAFLQAIDAALNVRPEHRPQNAAELRAMLQLDGGDGGWHHSSSTTLADPDQIAVAAHAHHTAAPTHARRPTAPATTHRPTAPRTASATAHGHATAHAAGHATYATAHATYATVPSPAPAIATEPGTEAPPPTSRGWGRRAALATGAALAVLAGVSAALWMGGGIRHAPAPAARTAVARPATPAAPAQPPCALHRPDGTALCPAMVKVPTGRYRIGSQPGERDAAPEEFGGVEAPVAAFELAAFETTVEQWQLCVADGACAALPASDSKPAMPVTDVSWDQVQSYLAWISKKTGTRYRLPTELEWEYAARAGTSTIFPWGGRIGERNAHCGQCGTLGQYPHAAPVGSFKAYAGLYDMVGNVYEWVADCWTPDHAPAAANAAPSADCKRKVQKGGAYDSMGADVRPMARTSGERTRGDPRVGFRLAR
jgi:formylglycine-generating enzyme required for sulfatase activity/serine/threonine protein kinase